VGFDVGALGTAVVAGVLDGDVGGAATDGDVT
jgi:hypothetical protein